MNTTDLRNLLAAPTVSRATFFAQFMGEPKKLVLSAPGSATPDDAAGEEGGEPAGDGLEMAQATPLHFLA